MLLIFCRRKRFEKLCANEKSVCKECRVLVLPEEKCLHVGHKVVSNVTDVQLQRPTRLLCTLEDNKANAVQLPHLTNNVYCLCCVNIYEIMIRTVPNLSTL